MKPSLSTPLQPNRRGVEKCADWLSFCLRIGWKRSDLDFLQQLWWKHHDENGNLT